MQQELANAKSICYKPVPKDSFYGFYNKQGMEYGPRFRLLEEIYRSESRISIASVREHQDDCPTGAFTHPATLDAAIQTCLASMSSLDDSQTVQTMVPHKCMIPSCQQRRGTRELPRI